MNSRNLAVEKLVGVNPNLISRAAETLPADENDRHARAARRVFAASVDTWLPVVVAMAKVAGQVHHGKDDKGFRRPRRFDYETWASLEEGAESVDVARVGLLRSCLELRSQYGDDVEKFLESLSQVVSEAVAECRKNLYPQPPPDNE